MKCLFHFVSVVAAEKKRPKIVELKLVPLTVKAKPSPFLFSQIDSRRALTKFGPNNGILC